MPSSEPPWRAGEDARGHRALYAHTGHEWWKLGSESSSSRLCPPGRDPPPRPVTSRMLLLVSESQLKDNPAFSMLNDSDDDVIYG